ncbi:MAG: hypothetical protein JWP65_784 [Ramlibacter sp.]|jgi:hypothetical protein|uniref:hypothetical protein n=1 Tax=Ramlibacter sp. TaxID=1917967 RepID=UPI00261020E1|nr:hypothetical protein [Ramlibacter sp.]MDB5750363.1 hypothetical protein [Ramlibacter sp.]
MTGIAHDFWQEQADEPPVHLAASIDPQVEDAHWQRAYWAQPYYRAELGYDDYAPAYCVGYIGQAQYGGRFEEAEKCLCANWVRIKGDSRLTLDEAMQAIRAAWDRAAQAREMTDEEDAELLRNAMTGRRARAADRRAYVAA